MGFLTDFIYGLRTPKEFEDDEEFEASEAPLEPDGNDNDAVKKEKRKGKRS